MTGDGGLPARLRDAAMFACEQHGFVRAAVVALQPPSRLAEYRAWLDASYHGSMDYMARPDHRAGREDPGRLLDGARSAVVVALPYEPTMPPASGDHPGPRGKVARYAAGRDYHDVIKERLRAVGAAIAAAAGAPIATRACVDTAPVLERDIADRAGLGFIGKNTMLITPGVGSYTLLGTLLVAAELAATEPEHTGSSRCGDCTACLDACPTSAFAAPFVLDARRCISYLTIEHRGAIDEPLRAAIGDWVFGCDVCQQVCPYNAAAPLRTGADPELSATDPTRLRPPLRDLVALGSARRRRLVADSAMRRTSRAQLSRNAAIALANTGEREHAELLESVADDDNPVVAEHAAWAAAVLRHR